MGCTECPAGSACPLGSDSPDNCPTNYYAEAGWGACAPCPAGDECPASQEEANPCAVGSYSLAEETTCTTCPAGEFIFKAEFKLNLRTFIRNCLNQLCHDLVTIFDEFSSSCKLHADVMYVAYITQPDVLCLQVTSVLTRPLTPTRAPPARTTWTTRRRRARSARLARPASPPTSRPPPATLVRHL